MQLETTTAQISKSIVCFELQKFTNVKHWHEYHHSLHLPQQKLIEEIFLRKYLSPFRSLSA